MEIVNVIVQTITLLTVVVTLVQVSKELRMTRRIHQENLDWNRKSLTQEAIKNVNELYIAELVEAFSEYRNKEILPIPLDVVQEKISQDSRVINYILKHLNLYEGLARGIITGLYDEEIVKLARKTAMTNSYIRYKNYIEYRREKINPNAWKEYEKLLKKWRIIE